MKSSNTLYYFIEDQIKNITSSLGKRFNATINIKTFDETNVNYWLIDLPIFEYQNELNVNAKKLKVIGHHFTIPNDIDSASSCYHYTVILKDSKNGDIYKSHVYFNNNDNSSVESNLINVNGTLNSQHIKMQNPAEILNLCFSCIDVILHLREKQKILLTTLEILKKREEEKLSELSKDLDNNKKQYSELCDKQIALISRQAKIGGDKFYGELKLFKKLKSTLNHSEKVQAQNMDVAQEVDFVAQKVEEFAFPAKLPKRKKRVAKTSQIISVDSVIKNAEDAVNAFDCLDDIKSSSELIKKMINSVNECDSCHLFCQEDKILSSVLNLRIALTRRINRFFDEVNLIEQADIYLLALQSGLSMMSDNFINEIIHQDRDDILERLISAGLLSEATKYNTSNSNEKFTIVELCVDFNSMKCFKVLLKNKFSLHYVDSDCSPLALMLSDPLKTFRYLSMIDENSDYSTRNNFYNHVVSLLRKNSSGTTGEENKLAQCKIGIIEEMRNLYNFLSAHKNRKLRLTVLGSQKMVSAIANNQAQAIELKNITELAQKDLRIQESTLKLMKTFNELLQIITPEFSGLVKNHFAGSENIDLTINSAPCFIELMNVRNQYNIKLMELYIEIIQSKQVTHYSKKDKCFIFKNKRFRSEWMRRFGELELKLPELSQETLATKLANMILSNEESFESFIGILDKIVPECSAKEIRILRNDVKKFNSHKSSEVEEVKNQPPRKKHG